jgi:hypothetical protein
MVKRDAIICARPIIEASQIAAFVNLRSAQRSRVTWRASNSASLRSKALRSSSKARDLSSWSCSRGATPGSYLPHRGQCRSFQMTCSVASLGWTIAISCSSLGRLAMCLKQAELTWLPGISFSGNKGEIRARLIPFGWFNFGKDRVRALALNFGLYSF